MLYCTQRGQMLPFSPLSLVTTRLSEQRLWRTKWEKNFVVKAGKRLFRKPERGLQGCFSPQKAWLCYCNAKALANKLCLTEMSASCWCSLHQVWWCWGYRGELCFMPHNVANACVTMGMVLPRSAKMAADPHLESEELCLLRKWTMVEITWDP